MILGFSGIKNDFHNSYDTPIFKNQERSPLSTFNHINLPPTCKNSEALYAEVIQQIQYQSEYRDRPLVLKKNPVASIRFVFIYS